MSPRQAALIIHLASRPHVERVADIALYILGDTISFWFFSFIITIILIFIAGDSIFILGDTIFILGDTIYLNQATQ